MLQLGMAPLEVDKVRLQISHSRIIINFFLAQLECGLGHQIIVIFSQKDPGLVGLK